LVVLYKRGEQVTPSEECGITALDTEEETRSVYQTILLIIRILFGQIRILSCIAAR
jgi:hypothetical protein